MLDCALCTDPPCTSACRRGMDPGRNLRSIWFGSENSAALKLSEPFGCAGCDAPCERNCVRPGRVPVRKLMCRLHDEVKSSLEVTDTGGFGRLRTDFCGIPLENPFLLSSSVVASTYEMCARALDAGWAGVCFKTISYLDIHEASPRFSALRGDHGEIIGFKNVEQLSDHSVAENMEILRRLKENYPTKLILVSIMGTDEEEWESLARECEKNHADAVELNFSCPNMTEEGLGSDICSDPGLVERFTAAAKRGCSIPVLAKLTPNTGSMAKAAKAAVRGGADGIAAINTIKSVTGVNLHTYVAAPAVKGHSAVGGYSGAAVKPIALRFIAEVAETEQMKGRHVSGMGGIETWEDALEFILLGAGSVQVTTAVMQYGYRIIDDLLSGLNYYLAEKGFGSIGEVIGLSLDTLSESTDVLERDTIVFPKFLPDKCIGCGRCMISCRDGGHQAITLDENRRPRLSGAKCVGCHLCILVCPQEAIRPSGKRIARKREA